MSDKVRATRVSKEFYGDVSVSRLLEILKDWEKEGITPDNIEASQGYDDSIDMTLYGHRPETERERLDREGREHLAKQEQDRRERAEFERLKKQFEGG